MIYLEAWRLIKRIMLDKMMAPLSTTRVIGTQIRSLNFTFSRATVIPAIPNRNTSIMKAIVAP